MIAAALAILAGRQLCLAILMHDASHHSLFKNKWLNNATDWLCAKPIWNDLHQYRAHHMRHHAKTSLPEDPDLSLVDGFPITKKSLLRKFTRDITGLTGAKSKQPCFHLCLSSPGLSSLASASRRRP